MRAFSSLIGHILGSHPDINGYYEMHINYQHIDNLRQQEHLYLQQETYKPGSHLLFDKLLHNSYELDLTRLNLHQPRLLVALRSAQPTIKGIVNLFQQKEGNNRYADPHEATQYYIQRLQKLSEFCITNQNAYYYFDAELIQSDTQDMLSTLTRWLQLDTPLSKDYQLFSQTGKPRAGDSSTVIQSGRIVKESTNYSRIELDEALLILAQEAYTNHRSIFIENALEQKTVNSKNNVLNH